MVCHSFLHAGGEGDNREWDGWMASPMRWTCFWFWVGSGSWWWTGKPGVLQSMGSQRVGHDWATELTESLSQIQICDPMDCSMPGSSIHGISQARILKWVSISSSGDLPTQGLNPHLLHWQEASLQLSHLGSPCWNNRTRLIERLKYSFT